MWSVLLGAVTVMMIGAVAVLLASRLLSRSLTRSAGSRILRRLADCPPTAWIVVLGSKPHMRSGGLNRHLIGRAAAGAALYHAEPSRRVLCSGRRHPDGSDEVEELAEALMRANVPREAIDFDRSGLRTIDSIVYLRDQKLRDQELRDQKLYAQKLREQSLQNQGPPDETFRDPAHVEAAVESEKGDRPVVLVTQLFHLPRTLYLARCAGLDAYGLAAEGTLSSRKGRVREMLGQWRAVFDVCLVGRLR